MSSDFRATILPGYSRGDSILLVTWLEIIPVRVFFLHYCFAGSFLQFYLFLMFVAAAPKALSSSALFFRVIFFCSLAGLANYGLPKTNAIMQEVMLDVVFAAST